MSKEKPHPNHSSAESWHEVGQQGKTFVVVGLLVALLTSCAPGPTFQGSSPLATPAATLMETPAPPPTAAPPTATPAPEPTPPPATATPEAEATPEFEATDERATLRTKNLILTFNYPADSEYRKIENITFDEERLKSFAQMFKYLRYVSDKALEQAIDLDEEQAPITKLTPEQNLSYASFLMKNLFTDFPEEVYSSDDLPTFMANFNEFLANRDFSKIAVHLNFNQPSAETYSYSEFVAKLEAGEIAPYKTLDSDGNIVIIDLNQPLEIKYYVVREASLTSIRSEFTTSESGNYIITVDNALFSRTDAFLAKSTDNTEASMRMTIDMINLAYDAAIPLQINRDLIININQLLHPAFTCTTGFPCEQCLYYQPDSDKGSAQFDPIGNQVTFFGTITGLQHLLDSDGEINQNIGYVSLYGDKNKEAKLNSALIFTWEQ